MNEYIVVSGGAGGIGSEIVKRFSAVGMNIIILDINPLNKQNIYRTNKGNILYYNVDIRLSSAIKTFVSTLTKEKIRISHLISLAGGALKGEFDKFENTDDDVFKQSINLNLNSHILLTKHLLPLMSDLNISNKSITYISSINAKMDFGLPAYSAAKSGLIGLTKTLSAELGKKGIRVNSVLPGTTLTDRTSKEPKDFSEYFKGSLLNRFASAEEIAEVVYCVAIKFTSVTGQEIIADCGQTVKGNYENY